MTNNGNSLKETGELWRESFNVLSNTNSEHSDNQSMADILVKIEARLQRIEGFEPRLSEIEKKLDNVNSYVVGLQGDVAALNVTVAALQSNLTGLSNIFDSVKENVDRIDRKASETDKQCRTLHDKVNSIESRLHNNDVLKDILDIRCRAMQQNLVFHGLQENAMENCEKLVKGFIADEMEIEKVIEFDTVHRIGKPNTNRTAPRKIVARFSNFKDRELVRMQAPKTLKNTRMRHTNSTQMK
jgi:chromosome segregation ATPase